jgi:hypothetical protein
MRKGSNTKTYSVLVRITGTAYIEVQAMDEEEALELAKFEAQNEVAIESQYDWEYDVDSTSLDDVEVV